MKGTLFAVWIQGWPEEASSVASHVDRLMEALLVTAAALVLILAGLNLYFLVRYREGSPAPRRPLRIAGWKIEAAWIVATTAGFLAFFFLGAKGYVEIERPPAGTEDIRVDARQWMWDIRQPNGRRELNELHVPTGTPVRLLLTSEDVVHSFYVPAFRIKQDAVPGKEVALWFNATKAGTYRFFCSEFCGTKHEQMDGLVVVLPPGRYADWLSRGNPAGGAAEGRRLFIRYGCSGCHSAQSTVHAPLLEGIYGSRVPVGGGGFVTVDDAYLRDSILLPAKTVPAGYPQLMPSFQGVISEAEIGELIAYIQSLQPDRADPARRASP